MEQQSVAQAHHVQQTRMQATIAQQSKLIDYLQGTPRSRLKIKKVLALFPASHAPILSRPHPLIPLAFHVSSLSYPQAFM